MQINSTSNPTLPHTSSLATTVSYFFDFSVGYAVFVRGCTLHPYSGYHYFIYISLLMVIIILYIYIIITGYHYTSDH